jgi:hypothetical protein
MHFKGQLGKVKTILTQSFSTNVCFSTCAFLSKVQLWELINLFIWLQVIIFNWLQEKSCFINFTYQNAHMAGTWFSNGDFRSLFIKLSGQSHYQLFFLSGNGQSFVLFGVLRPGGPFVDSTSKIITWGYVLLYLKLELKRFSIKFLKL